MNKATSTTVSFALALKDVRRISGMLPFPRFKTTSDTNNFLLHGKRGDTFQTSWSFNALTQGYNYTRLGGNRWRKVYFYDF